MANQFTDQEVSQLRGQTECFIHRHPREQADFVDRVDLMAAEPVRNIVGVTTYDIARTDELLLVDTSTGSVTVVLPPAGRGREFKAAKVSAANNIVLQPSGGEHINGSTVGLEVAGNWGVVWVKAVAGGYVVISATCAYTVL